MKDKNKTRLNIIHVIIKKQNKVIISKISKDKAEFKDPDEQKLFESKLDLVSKEEELFTQKNSQSLF